MSARALRVHIRRLVVDDSLQGEAAGWTAAIEHALRARLIGAPDADRSTAPAESPTEAIAREVARRVGSEGATRPNQTTLPAPSGQVVVQPPHTGAASLRRPGGETP
jgi:hypothetical protein